MRIAPPYDADARWAAKGEELFWNGYKVHLTETCDDDIDEDADDTDAAGEEGPERGGRPNLITNVATTPSTVPDVKMTTPINQALAQRRLLPAEHYLDSGYPSAQTITDASAFGITLVTPALLDHSPQAKAVAGFDKSAFAVGWAAQQVTCPLGQTSSSWSPAIQHGTTGPATSPASITFSQPDGIQQQSPFLVQNLRSALALGKGHDPALLAK